MGLNLGKLLLSMIVGAEVMNFGAMLPLFK